MGESNISKLVSLTFDENPEVRKNAAHLLSEVDDPAAIFALMELSFDKDIGVREFAKQKLDMKKQAEQEVMSFATIFENNSEKKEENISKSDIVNVESKEKILQPITRLFEKRLGKERATAVRNKMMPSIEKIYLNVRDREKKENDSGRKAMQEFLTSYLEVISDLDQIGTANSQQTGIKAVAAEVEMETIKESNVPKTEKEVLLSEELEEVGKTESFDNVSKEVNELEVNEKEEIQKEIEIQGLPDTFFKKAYEIMMLSGCDDTIMKQEMQRMIADANREIGLAFKLAKKKFKENKITNIAHIKDSMRNINTEPLVVKSVENIQYNKTKKSVSYLTRVLVNDGVGNEGVIYLFDNKGTEIKPYMKVKVVKGTAKTFDFSKETALTLGKKGNVYIIL